jgi:hypothetical protein
MMLYVLKTTLPRLVVSWIRRFEAPHLWLVWLVIDTVPVSAPIRQKQETPRMFLYEGARFN